MPATFVMVCEAPADFTTAATLAERVLCEAVLWLPDVLPHCPLWAGRADRDPPFYRWDELKTLAAARGVKAVGRFADGPTKPDAVAARRALKYVAVSHPSFDAVVVVRDQDGQPERRGGLNQARDEHATPDRVVIGFAIPKRECWVLAGFDPCDAVESTTLADVRRELGFDPRTHAHNLTASHDHDKLSAKRVLRLLVNDHAREARCLADADLAALETRGGDSGLAAFIAEIRDRLAPLLTRD